MPSLTGFIAGLGQVRLSLELTATQTASGGDILAVAILTTDRNPVPIDGQTIAFYLGANEVPSQSTEADGRASHTFAGLGFGTHAVSVQIAGVHVTQRHTFSPPVTTLKTATILNVGIIGTRGQQSLLISVSGDDGMLIPKFPFTIVDGGNALPSHTEDDGTLLYHPKPAITEPSRPFTVRAGNKPELAWRGRLLGPKPPPQPAP